MLKEEIVHYKNLVATKEKELNNLTVVFNQNMTENKHEVRFSEKKSSAIKTLKTSSRFDVFMYFDALSSTLCHHNKSPKQLG